MKKTALIGSVITFCAINAFGAINQELIQKAKNSGLQPIPSGKALAAYQLQKAKDTDLATGYNPKMTQAQIELGKKLYFDPRISSSNLISCNTCHNLALGGVDVVPVAIGEKWQPNPHHLNSPTVYNSVFNSVQFWDGRAFHLGDQAQGPIQNPVEMAATPKLVVEKITSIPAYVDEFKKAYGNKVKIDFKLIGDTIAMFEETLVTPSRYDDFLNGNPKALSKQEQEGLNTFIDKGCIACHNGINLGGTMQPFGIVKPYEFANVGDFKGDANGMVKVPTLRNIAETMPYFHNGQYWDVKDAIKEMGAIQLGITINDQEAKKIETFFQSLTGTKPTITYPVLAPVTDKTPKPIF
ncbi:cytochrome-c peroxidase [Helicobacter sp. 11S03491-1]|uniref:cytochrome-c peroxidase n=1 Tax=Helicobacter sp. 11S03491-1 TaxID=1476196 RepID=UPI000BA68317|nr:cytochrome-c peroxidase [Helicobacter sp. 11S03491-1]PAF43804.1 cytochrome C biogenesis protein CcsA [Helicobacter sp. 11S03491-1]